MKRFITLVACALFALPGIASATVLSETINFGPGTPNFNSTLTFQKYHGGYGNLVSVKVILNLDIDGGTLIVDNDGVGPAHVDTELGATAAISSLDVTLLDNLFQPVTGVASASTVGSYDLAGNIGDGANDYDPSGPDGAQLIGQADSDMKMGFINSLFHPGFVGAGTFDIKAQVNQILDFGGVGGVEGGFTAVNAGGSVTVQYTLDKTPEPASAAMLGLAGLLVLARVRR